MHLRASAAVLFCLLVLATTPVPVRGERPPKPHVILLVADDLGWGDVGYHGSRIQTPNIDALARRGVQLDQFYVQPVCSPTRAALLTGRYPMRLGLQCGVVRPWARHGLPLAERTLAETLRKVGYRTAIVGKWHLGHVTPQYLPTRRGFDLQYGHYNGALDYFTHRRDGGHDWHRNDQPDYDRGYTTDLIGAEAERILAEHDPSQPLFLYVPFNAPHTPLQAPPKWVDKYKHLKRRNRRIFAAMVACMDAAVGRITDAARKHLDPARTVVFFSSDNGGIRRLGSNGKLRAGKGTLYEGGVHVPALISWPGQLTAGGIVRQPLHVVDLYPTLLHLAGVAEPAKGRQDRLLDGKNAWPTVASGKPSPHASILLNVTPFHGAVREGDWKLIRNGHITANAVQAKGSEQWELFNLRADPSETKDLSAAQPEILKRLQARLNAFSQEAAKPNIPPNRPPPGFKVPQVWGHAKN